MRYIRLVTTFGYGLTYEHYSRCSAIASYIDHSHLFFLLDFLSYFLQLDSLTFSGILDSYFLNDLFTFGLWFEGDALRLAQLCDPRCLTLYSWMSLLSCTCSHQEAHQATCSWAACPQWALQVSYFPSLHAFFKSDLQWIAFLISQAWCASGWAGVPTDCSSWRCRQVKF